MPWPGLTDFTEAVQNPGVCFRGTELESARVEVNRRGLPLVFSGSFASVYPVTVGQQKFAVRCFTREPHDQQSRYEELSNYLISVLPPSFVHFEYLERGINSRGAWYPIVKMEWVEGVPLSKFVDSNLNDPDLLRRLAAQWRGGPTASLRGLRIAHNDLQHGNVMVQNDGDIRLVDYDGMFLPQFRGQRSPELGHKNYQHPQRSSEDYDDYVDNFPTLVIYTSLLGIAADPGLWAVFFNEDNLIFTRDDYADPAGSQLFGRLKNSPDPMVAALAGKLEQFCALPAADVPDLEEILQDIPPTPAPSPSAATAPNPTTSGVPPAPQPAPAPPPVSQAQVPAPSTPAAGPGPAAPVPGCANCGQPVAPGDRFCNGCGAPITAQAPSQGPSQVPSQAPAGQACRACGQTIGPTDRFCHGCGAPVAVPSAGAPQIPRPVAASYIPLPGPPARSSGVASFLWGLALLNPRAWKRLIIGGVVAVAVVGLAYLAVSILRADEPVPPPAAPPSGTDLPPAGISASLSGNPSGNPIAAPVPPVPTDTPVPTPTHTPVPTNTPTPIPTSAPTATLEPTPAPTPTPVPTPPPPPTATAVPLPTATPVPPPPPTPTPQLSAAQAASQCRVVFDGLDVKSAESSVFTQPGYSWRSLWQDTGRYETGTGFVYHFEIRQEEVQHVDVYPVLYSWTGAECRKNPLTNHNTRDWAGHPATGDDPAILTFDVAALHSGPAYSWLCLWKNYGRPGNVLLSCTAPGSGS